MFDDLQPLHKSIVEDRAYDESPMRKLAAKYNMPEGKIKDIIDANQEYLDYLIEERRLSMKMKFDKNIKLSVKCLTEILKTDHKVEVFNREGECVGTKIDKDVLKLKKEVAERVLEETKVIEPVKKGGGIQINTQVNNSDDNAQKEEIARKQELESLLDDCRVIEHKGD